MTTNKFGSSCVTWSLPIRVLLTSAAILPVLLLASAFMAIAESEPGGALLLPIAGVSLCLAPRYLAAVWEPRPGWLFERKAERLRNAQVQHSLAKELGVAPRTSAATHTTISRRRW